MSFALNVELQLEQVALIAIDLVSTHLCVIVVEEGDLFADLQLKVAC